MKIDASKLRGSQRIAGENLAIVTHDQQVRLL